MSDSRSKAARVVTPREVEQWRKDLRRMTKLYRSIPTDSEEAFKAAVQEVGGYWRTFERSFRDWLGNLALPNLYLEGSLESLYDLGRAAADELTALFPTYRDTSTGRWLPSMWKLGEERPAILRRYQTAFKRFFDAADAYLREEGGGVERPPIIERLTVGPVSVEVVNWDRERHERAFQGFLKRVPIMVRQVQAAGFGRILRGLVLNVVFDPTTVASGTAGPDTINIYPGGLGTSTTFLHEIGHWVYTRLLTRQAQREWYDTLKARQEAGTQEFITTYGATNPDEAFADAFRLYVGQGPRALGPWTRRFFEQITRGSGAMRTAAEVGTDTAEIYAIAPEALYNLVNEGDWQALADTMWGDGPHDEGVGGEEPWEEMQQAIRQHGGAVFQTGGDGTWDVTVEGAVSEQGYTAPYGTPEYGKTAAATEQAARFEETAEAFMEALRRLPLSMWAKRVPETDQVAITAEIKRTAQVLDGLLEITFEDPGQAAGLKTYLRRVKNLRKMVRQIEAAATGGDWDGLVDAVQSLGTKSKAGTMKLREYINEVKAIIRTFDAEVEATFDVGGFHLVLYRMGLGEWDAETVGRLKWVMEEASRLLGQRGMGRVIGGTVYAFPTATVPGTGSAMAWYRHADDVLTVAAGSSWFLKKSPKRVLQTVIHELGHRAWYRVVTGGGRAEWEEFYERSLDMPDVDSMIAEWESAARDDDPRVERRLRHLKEYYAELKKRDPQEAAWLLIVVQSLDLDRGEKFDSYHGLPTKTSVPALDELIRRKNEVRVFMHPVTVYSATSATELFAEVFAHYIVYGPRTVKGIVRAEFAKVLPGFKTGSVEEEWTRLAAQLDSRLARDPCNIHDYSTLWIDPHGTVHKLRAQDSHGSWADRFIRGVPTLSPEYESYGQPWDPNRGIEFLLSKGWIRVANLAAIEMESEQAPPSTAKKALAGVLIDCALKLKESPESITVIVDYTAGGGARHSLADAVRLWGGRGAESKLFGALLEQHGYRAACPRCARPWQRNASGLMPLMEATHNLREIAKQCLLLEDHLFHQNKQCPDCINKHIMTIEALAEEAVSLKGGEEHTALCDQVAERARAWQEAVFTEGAEDVAQAVRQVRKDLVALTQSGKTAGAGAAAVPDEEWVRLAGGKYKEKKEVDKADGSGKTTVYEYGPIQVSKRNKEKAERVETLRKNMGRLRAQVRKDLDAKDAQKRLTALAIALIDATYERVGNEESAAKGHFGVTGWSMDHLTFKGKKCHLDYVGKSGVKQHKVIDDAKIVGMLKDLCKDKGKGEKILCEGEECDILADDVNEYLKPYDVTAKDLRGYHANEEMQTRLRDLRKKGEELPRARKERDEILKAEFTEALEATAAAVGHEPSTLRSQYLVPGLEEEYLHDGTVTDKMVKDATSRFDSCNQIEEAWSHLAGVRTSALRVVRESEGRYGEPRHMTRIEEGTLPIQTALKLKGARNEQDYLKWHDKGGERWFGKYREPRWQAFVEDIRTRGIQDPVFIVVDPNDGPLVYEGNHRIQAASQAGLREVPVEVRYFGHAERDYDIEEGDPPRWRKRATKTDEEKEEEKVEGLVRPSPKKKPPRNDLRKERVEEEDPDLKQDVSNRKDRSLNFKDIGASYQPPDDEDGPAQPLREYPADARYGLHAASLDEWVRFAADGPIEEDATQSKGKGVDPLMVQFLDEHGDDEETNPDTGKKVKLKSLSGKPKDSPAKKVFNERFDAWKEKQKAEEDTSAGEAPAEEDEEAGAAKAVEIPEAFVEKYPDLDGKVMAAFIDGLDMSMTDQQLLEALDSHMLENLPEGEELPDWVDTMTAKDLGKLVEQVSPERKAFKEQQAREKAEAKAQRDREKEQRERVTKGESFVLGGVELSQDNDPRSKSPSREALQARSQEALDSYLGQKPDARAKALKSLQNIVAESAPGSPKYNEARAILRGVALAAHVEDDGDVEGIPRPPPQLRKLQKLMVGKGRPESVLDTADDFESVESRSQLMDTLGASMSDDDLIEFAGNDNPLKAMASILTQTSRVDPRTGEEIPVDEGYRALARKMMMLTSGLQITVATPAVRAEWKKGKKKGDPDKEVQDSIAGDADVSLFLDVADDLIGMANLSEDEQTAAATSAIAGHMAEKLKGKYDKKSLLGSILDAAVQGDWKALRAVWKKESTPEGTYERYLEEKKAEGDTNVMSKKEWEAHQGNASNEGKAASSWLDRYDFVAWPVF